MIIKVKYDVKSIVLKGILCKTMGGTKRILIKMYVPTCWYFFMLIKLGIDKKRQENFATTHVESEFPVANRYTTSHIIQYR